MSDCFRVGDMVRVRNPASFVSWLAKRIADRDAVVVWVGPVNGGFHNRAKVRFLKRNGRGKEFEHIFDLFNLEVKSSAAES